MKKWLFSGMVSVSLALSAQTLFEFEGKTDGWRLSDAKQGAELSCAPEEESKIGDGALKVLTPGRKERVSFFADLGKPPAPDSAYLSFYVRVPRPTILLAALRTKQDSWHTTFRTNGNGWNLENIPFTEFINANGRNIVEAGKLASVTQLQFTIVKENAMPEAFYFDEIRIVGKRIPLESFVLKRPDDLLRLDFKTLPPERKPFRNPDLSPGLIPDSRLGSVLHSELAGKEGVSLPLPQKISQRSGTLEILLRPLSWEKIPNRTCQYLFYTMQMKYGTSLKTLLYIYKDELGNLTLSVLVGRYKGMKDINFGAPIRWKNNEWHTAALVWNKEKVELFADGRKVREGLLPAADFPDGLPLGREFQLIGPLGKTGQFSGDIGLVRISGETMDAFPLLEK